MVHLWRDPETGQYGLKQFRLSDGSFAHYVRIDDSLKPRQIKDHGTMVVLLGDEVDADTMQSPPGAPSPSRWVARYLNTRYFRFPEGVTVRAREGWDRPRSDQSVNVLRRVIGQEEYLEAHSESSGSVPVSGGRVRWWILKNEKALSQNTGSLASSGHAAALYQDELYEMVTGVAGIARSSSASSSATSGSRPTRTSGRRAGGRRRRPEHRLHAPDPRRRTVTVAPAGVGREMRAGDAR